MELRRKIQGNERRRRVLRDDTGQRGDNDRGESRSTRETFSPATYCEQARAENQPRITEFIPTRPYTLSLVLTSSLTAVAAVELLHAYHSDWLPLFSREDLSAFDVAQGNSIAAWMSSLLLLAAAFSSLFIFHIRRHRIDDYFGRYSLWLWVTAGCFVASMDTVAHCHLIVQSLASKLMPATMFGDGSIWWVSLSMGLAFLIGLRAVLDMRGSWLARAFLVVSGICYTTASLAYLDIVQAVDPKLQAMMESSSLLLGHVNLQFSLLVYLRHVYLDAQGALTSQRKEKKASPSYPSQSGPVTTNDSTKKTWRKNASSNASLIDDRETLVSPNGENGSDRQSMSGRADSTDATESSNTDNSLLCHSKQRSATTSEMASAEELAGQSGRKLTKAQRKRLRKQMRRQRNAA